MKKLLTSFVSDDRGAVTVDWVVLTAAVVGLGAAAYVAIETNTGQLSADIGATIGNENVTAESVNAATGVVGG